MLIKLLLLILGLALLIKGADWLVDGASSLARKFQVSDLAIGLTIVAFGTSAPELLVNSFASFEGHADIVWGNVIGSNIFNLFVILGITGLITPLAVKSGTVWKEVPWSLLAVVLLWIFANDFWAPGSGLFSRWDAVFLLVLFGMFLYYVYTQLKTDPADLDIPHRQHSAFKTWAFIILGLTGLIIGGRMAVNNAVEIATALGMSERVIGLTILAAGTSLPELATSVMAAVKKNNDIAIGNIIGSNIFNILLIIPTGAMIRPILYSRGFNLELYLLAGGTLFLFIAMFTGKKYRLDRWEAAVLLLAYTAYSIYLLG